MVSFAKVSCVGDTVTVDVKLSTGVVDGVWVRGMVIKEWVGAALIVGMALEAGVLFRRGGLVAVVV